MNKKIKIIDLFKRIEKHEDIPKKIKYKDNYYIFKHANYSIDHLYELIGHECIGWLEHKDINLFDEVEILEDNTEEIEEIEEISDEYFNMLSDESKVKWLKSYIKEDRDKINELVKVVNKLRKENKK